MGGHYHLEDNASGTILSCDPLQSFTATWEYGGNVSWIEVRIIAERRRQARFELDHICHIEVLDQAQQVRAMRRQRPPRIVFGQPVKLPQQWAAGVSEMAM